MNALNDITFALDRGWRIRGGGYEYRKMINGQTIAKNFRGPHTLERYAEVKEEAELWLQERQLWIANKHAPKAVKYHQFDKALSAAFSRMFSDARRRKRYELTEDDEQHLIERCGNKCEVTGLPFGIHGGFRTEPFRPSLDRIDANGNYTADNVRIVCWAVNNAMSDWGEEVFAAISKAYVRKLLG